MKFQCYLWPDHVIGKRESRTIREEHNALVNSHAELLAALAECVTDPGAMAWNDRETAYRRMRAINETARAAIDKATAQD